jgi:hypothetical protein
LILQVEQVLEILEKNQIMWGLPVIGLNRANGIQTAVPPCFPPIIFTATSPTSAASRSYKRRMLG